MFKENKKPFIVLLVDDDFDFLELVAQQLEEHEGDRTFQVYVAADGTEAVAQIASLNRIDALVTDLNMPGSDGLAVALTFRRCFPEKPIILTTAASVADDRIASFLQLSRAAFLPKPFAVSALVEKLRMASMAICPLPSTP